MHANIRWWRTALVSKAKHRGSGDRGEEGGEGSHVQCAVGIQVVAGVPHVVAHPPGLIRKNGVWRLSSNHLRHRRCHAARKPSISCLIIRTRLIEATRPIIVAHCPRFFERGIEHRWGKICLDYFALARDVIVSGGKIIFENMFSKMTVIRKCDQV